MSIDLVIIVAFLILTLVVGIGHGQKVKNIEDYALGGRNFSTIALVSTIVATWASGSGFFVTLSKTYTDGFYYMFARFGLGIYFLIVSLIFLPKMSEFLGKVSIAEAMGDIYGKKARFVTAFAGTIGSAGSIAVQFKVFGSIFSYFLYIPSSLAIILSGCIATIYSAFGGIRAVTFTDVLQFFSFGVIIPLLGFILWGQFYYDGYSVEYALSNPKFNFITLFDFSNNDFFSFLVLFIYFAIPTWSASMFQRVAMGSNLPQVRKAFFISGIILILIQILVAWIPFLMHTINPDIESKYLLSYIVDHYSYTGLKGLILVAIIAFAMSTADSRINSASVLFTHDIYGLFIKNKKNDILISRLFALFLGVGAILFSLIDTDILGVLLFANSFYYPLVTLPFILTVIGFRSSEKSILIGMGAGFIVTVLWKFLPIEFISVSQKIIGIFIAMFFNALFLFGSHYLLKQKGGWVGIKDKNYYLEKQKNASCFKNNFLKLINEFNLINSLKKLSPHNEITYTALGVYFIICTITTMYSTQIELLGQNAQLMKTLYPFMLVTGTSIALYPIWPLSVSTNIKKFIIQLWYPVAVFYMLIFFSLFFVLVSKFAMLQVALLMMNLMIASLLLGWRLILPLMVIGLYCSVQLYQNFFSLNNFAIQFGSPEFILLYLLLITSIVLFFFLKPKQEEQERSYTKIKYLKKEVDYTQRELADISQGIDFLQDQFKDKEGVLNKKAIYLRDQLRVRNDEISKLINTKDEFLRNITHESNTPMTGILSLCDVLYSYYDQLDSTKVKSTIKDIVNSGDRLQTYVNSIVDLSKLSSNNYKLTREDIDLGELAKERTILYKKIFSDDTEKQEFIFDIEGDFIVNCDRYYITQTIDNLISNAVNYGKGKPVTIAFKRTEDNSVSFSISDQGIGIPRTEILSIFSKFEVGSRTSTPAGGRGVGLALCKSVIEAHEGAINATSKGKGATFTFSLPMKV